MTISITDVTGILDAVLQLQAESDESSRRTIGDSCLADDIEFFGLSVHSSGKEEFLEHFRGDSLVRNTEVSFHDGFFRFGWELQDDQDVVVTNDSGDMYAGVAFGRVDQHGRISLLVPFAG